MPEKGDLLTLSDGKKYAVIDTYNESQTIYLYLIDVEDNTNIMFSKLDGDEIVELGDPNEIEKVMRAFKDHLYSN